MTTAEQHEDILTALAGEFAHSRIAQTNGTAVRWTYNADGSMTATPMYELDDAVSIEDALDFIARGFTRQQHLECFRPEHFEREGRMYDEAVKLVGAFGTARKAQNYINGQIDLYR